MRGFRALLVACTIMAGVAIPLGVPAVALADPVAMGPVVAITGAVESRPADGIAGTWIVDGTEFETVEGTRLLEAAGPAEVDAQVAVLAWRTADEALQAFMIRVQSPAQAAWLRSLLARVRNVLEFTARLRVRSCSQEQLQTQTRLQTQEQNQEQTGSQAQEQLQEQTRERTRAQERLQEQQQERLQEQTQSQTQQQLQEQTQMPPAQGCPSPGGCASGPSAAAAVACVPSAARPRPSAATPRQGRAAVLCEPPCSCPARTAEPCPDLSLMPLVLTRQPALGGP